MERFQYLPEARLRSVAFDAPLSRLTQRRKPLSSTAAPRAACITGIILAVIMGDTRL